MQNSNQVFFTTTKCLDWKPILLTAKIKDIVVQSLNYLVEAERVSIFGFVIMPNHFHLLWKMMNGQKREYVQRDFLKYTAQQILKELKSQDYEQFSKLWVALHDREYQVWARHSLNVPIWSPFVWRQKLGYIHSNPVRAGLCSRREDYKYSSYKSYQLSNQSWPFLTISRSGKGFI
ncbi:MAG: transposase [Cyclobacteriaceae bacterium]|nr:transposase [Cyclobacteriaceae bacterium]